MIINKIKPIEEILKEKYLKKRNKENISFGDFVKSLDPLLDVFFKEIPPIFKNAQITNKKIEDFLYDKPLTKGLFIHGECGTGKTYNFYGVYKTLKFNFKIMNINQRVKFTNISNFFSEIKQTFGDPHSEEIINNLIKTSSILFLDDFSSEKTSEWTIESLHRLIDYRYEQMLPTFISSNLNLKELADRVGDRIPSRMAQMCDIIKFEGGDQRILKVSDEEK